MKIVVIICALAVIIGRLLITPRLELPTAEGSYEAFAHLFVGGLFGAWWAIRYYRHRYFQDEKRLFVLAVGLSAFELAGFLWQKYLTK